MLLLDMVNEPDTLTNSFDVGLYLVPSDDLAAIHIDMVFFGVLGRFDYNVLQRLIDNFGVLILDLVSAIGNDLQLLCLPVFIHLILGLSPSKYFRSNNPWQEILPFHVVEVNKLYDI